MSCSRWIIAGYCGPGLQENAKSAGDQYRGDDRRPVVRHVGRGSVVRGVRQSDGQTPGPDCQVADIPAPACGQCPVACVATSAQLRLVDGRGASDRVGGRPTERGYRAILRGPGGCRPRFRPPEMDCRGLSRLRVRRLVHSCVQRFVLRRFRGGRARVVHTTHGLLLVGWLFGRRARQVNQWSPVNRRVCTVCRDGGHIWSADCTQESRLAR